MTVVRGKLQLTITGHNGRVGVYVTGSNVSGRQSRSVDADPWRIGCSRPHRLAVTVVV